MTYGHAERNLALLRQLETETRHLLEHLDQPDPEQSAWLQEAPAPQMTTSADGPPGHRRPGMNGEHRAARPPHDLPGNAARARIS